MKRLTRLTICLALAGLANAAIAAPLPVNVNLIADGGDTSTDAGAVDVTDEGATIRVAISAEGNWLIAEAHADLDKSSNCSGVPQTGSGNPKVGKFEKDSPYALPGVTSVNLDFADDTDCGETWCVAAHAVVYDGSLVGPDVDNVSGCDENDDDTVSDEEALECSGESAWGDGTGFSGKNWAMYFTFDTPACI